MEGHTPDRRKSLGQRGEQLAAAYLRKRGYHILDSNWRHSLGELDIVAREGETLVFVEVRTRHADSTERAFESITPYKRHRLITLAHAYLSVCKLETTNWRVDVIAIAIPRFGPPLLDHAEDALSW